MSSKLVRADEARRVEAMVWRTVASAGGMLAGLAGTGGALDGDSGVEQRIRAAHAAGLREGEVSGQRRAAAELRPVIERLCQSIEEISSLRARLRGEAERDLVRLALAIARRVLGRELTIDPEALHGLVLGALDKVKAQELCRVRVHPGQQAAITECLRKAMTAAVEVVADPACQPGTVILETERGSLDASVDSQLAEIERGLADRLRRQA